jgi:hypothetical protein
MKKVILSLMFVLATGTSFMNASDTKQNIIDNGGDLKQCWAFATEIACINAIWNNNSFEEEDADIGYYLNLCMNG